MEMEDGKWKVVICNLENGTWKWKTEAWHLSATVEIIYPLVWLCVKRLEICGFRGPTDPWLQVSHVHSS